MAETSLEERIQRLEEVNEKQNKEIQRLKDVNEIMNLMHKFEYKNVGGLLEEVADMFALKTPDVRVELGNWGIREGGESVRKYWVEGHVGVVKTPGVWVLEPATTPVIEVAGDGKTAKGLWICPGFNTRRIENTPPHNLKAHWLWVKHAVDFIKEDGEWKIWHFHLYAIFNTPYDKSWVEHADEYDSIDDVSRLPDSLQPDKPGTYHRPYNPKLRMEYVPAAPEPYETFDETFSY